MEQLQQTINALQQELASLRSNVTDLQARVISAGGNSASTSGFKQDSIMDFKAFNRHTNFKGGGSGAWLKWIKKFESLINRT